MSRRTGKLLVGGLLLAGALAVVAARLIADVRNQASELRALTDEKEDLCVKIHWELEFVRTALKKREHTVQHVRDAREWLVLPAAYCATPNPAIRREIRDRLLMLHIGPQFGPEDAAANIEHVLALLSEWQRAGWRWPESE